MDNNFPCLILLGDKPLTNLIYSEKRKRKKKLVEFLLGILQENPATLIFLEKSNNLVIFIKIYFKMNKNKNVG